MRGTNRSRTAWLVVMILLLASVAAPLNQFKVPPILPLLMTAFNLSVDKVGLLMSVFAVTGIILALPAGFISQRLGYKLTGLLAVVAVAMGAAIGPVSTRAGMMLGCRVVEGVRTSLLEVIAAEIIDMRFTSSRRGVNSAV